VSFVYISGYERTQVDIAEAAATDLTTDTVLVPHAEVLLSCQHIPFFILYPMLACFGYREVEGIGVGVPLSSCLRVTSAARICFVFVLLWW